MFARDSLGKIDNDVVIFLFKFCFDLRAYSKKTKEKQSIIDTIDRIKVDRVKYGSQCGKLNNATEKKKRHNRVLPLFELRHNHSVKNGKFVNLYLAKIKTAPLNL